VAPRENGCRTTIRWFEDIELADVPGVGGKNASLGAMYRDLAAHGIRVPNGFAVAARALSGPSARTIRARTWQARAAGE
jgi:hypothetical protein